MNLNIGILIISFILFPLQAMESQRLRNGSNFELEEKKQAAEQSVTDPASNEVHRDHQNAKENGHSVKPTSENNESVAGVSNEQKENDVNTTGKGPVVATDSLDCARRTQSSVLSKMSINALITQLVLGNISALEELLKRYQTAKGDKKIRSAILWTVFRYLNERDEIASELCPYIKQFINDRTLEGDCLLILAAYFGNESLVRALLTIEGIDVNAMNNTHETPLLSAIRQNKFDTIRTLLAVKGINVNQANWRGDTALMRAASQGQEEIVQLLLTIPGIQLHAKNRDGQTALDVANSERIRQLLIETSKSQPKPRSQVLPDNLHGLVTCLTTENEDFVLDAIRRLVLIEGRDVDALKEYDLSNGQKIKRTALYCALVQNCIPAAEVLLQLGADPQKIDSDGIKRALSTRKELAALLNEVKIWSEEERQAWKKSFLKQEHEARKASYKAAIEAASSLLDAVTLQNVKLVQKFLQSEEPTQEILSYALYKAAHPPKNLDEKQKSRYLANTANILFELVGKKLGLLLVKGSDGRTPLYDAVGLRSLEIVEQLLNLATVDPNYFLDEDNGGHSVISYASLLGCEDIASLLQKRYGELKQLAERYAVVRIAQPGHREPVVVYLNRVETLEEALRPLFAPQAVRPEVPAAPPAHQAQPIHLNNVDAFEQLMRPLVAPQQALQQNAIRRAVPGELIRELFASIEANNYDRIKALAQRMSFFVRNERGDNPLHHAVIYWRDEEEYNRIIGLLLQVCPRLVTEKNQDGFTPVKLAIVHNKFRLLDLFVALGVQRQ